MLNELESLIRKLENRSDNWVVRRDAAEALGKVAHAALAALVAHRSDADMDVQLQVERSLEGLRAIALPPTVGTREFTLRELAYACEKRPVRIVEPWENGFAVTVKLNDERSQRVIVTSYDTRESRLVRIYTPCGSAKPDLYEWALKANGRLAMGCFALVRTRSGDRQLVLLHTLPRKDATPQLVKAAVKQIALLGDEMEKRIEGGEDKL
ncbi:MAG TPA: hypothetical protein PLO53_00725 [Candidatus Hydrogenedentes bacterium]|nr:hypothetical protein [Candidatus Hydrogenedentota bacterium]